ncbi:MAG TPA: DUF3857 domain-containing protein [Cytophagales bacterium]|nr:DUF3857 domain-containing protein [Cytophagales bacterium]
MKKYLAIPFLYFPLVFASLAQSRADLNVNLIPKELITNANAVVRSQEFITEVADIDNVIYKRKTAITILNSNGAEYAPMIVHYDKSIAVKNLSGNLYDKSGTLVYKIPESKFRDYSNIQGFSLFEDNRVKYFNPAYSTYPFTIEFEYEVKYKNSFYFLDWIPQRNGDLSVEKSIYTFICDEDYPVRIKEYNFSGEKKESKDKGSNVYKWEISNLKSFKEQRYLPQDEKFLPIVKIAPVKFEYEGIKGSFSTWEEYGKWTYENLLKGRESLPMTTIIKINGLVRDLKTPKEKAKKIYEYVQSKTRYVSIQKGIGGIQPMTAEEVDRLSYGDCKALSFYTQSLLKAVGIESHYTELFAGPIRDISPDFPSFQGNHAILCVPFEKDTVWLECTSQTNPFGYLGSFTDNRKVILCTKQGGIVATTRSYSPLESSQIRKAFFLLDAEGNLEGNVTTQFQGIQYDNRDRIVSLSGRDRTEEILKLYPINNLDIKKYEISQDKQGIPVMTEELNFYSSNYGAKSSNRIFLYINPVNQFHNFLKDLGARKNPIFIPRGYLDEDLLEYTLPENYKIEHLPKDVNLKNEFGEFSCKTTLEGDKLIYQRKMLLNEGTFPPESYQKLREYYLKIALADQQKLVLIKN